MKITREEIQILSEELTKLFCSGIKAQVTKIQKNTLPMTIKKPILESMEIKAFKQAYRKYRNENKLQ